MRSRLCIGLVHHVLVAMDGVEDVMLGTDKGIEVASDECLFEDAVGFASDVG